MKQKKLKMKKYEMEFHPMLLNLIREASETNYSKLEIASGKKQ